MGLGNCLKGDRCCGGVDENVKQYPNKEDICMQEKLLQMKSKLENQWLKTNKCYRMSRSLYYSIFKYIYKHLYDNKKKKILELSKKLIIIKRY